MLSSLPRQVFQRLAACRFVSGEQRKNSRSILLKEELSLQEIEVHAVNSIWNGLPPPISDSIESVFQTVLWRLGPIALFLASGLSSPAAEVEVAPAKGGQFVGVAGCKSSSCHGGAGEKRNQYLTWSQKDFHARAYAILTNARSARMAETLGLPAAQESSRCTVCHSPFQSRRTCTARADRAPGRRRFLRKLSQRS